MATNTNYTTKTAALKATKADMRQVQVSKKLTSKEVWIDDAEGVSTNVLELISDAQDAATQAASGALAEAKGELTEAIGAVSDKVDNMKLGIDIGTKDDPFEDGTDNVGFAPAISRINFKGAYVNVLYKNDGTVDLWINPDNNKGKLKKATFNPPSTNNVPVFASSTSAYVLPTSAGSSFARCHTVGGAGSFTLYGEKDGSSVAEFSIGNLTSKIRVDVLVKGSTTPVATYTTPFIKNGVTTTKTNGITVTLGSLKEYKEADAENGFVPGTVSCTATVSLDLGAILGKGNTWSAKVYLEQYSVKDGVETLENTVELGSTGNEYFAYTTEDAVISANPTVTAKVLKTRWVSGVEYVDNGSTFDVTYGTITKGTVMVSDHATNRGTIGLAQCGNAVNITGATSDTEATTIAGGTQTFTLASTTKTVQDSLTATHTAYDGNSTNTTKTGSYTNTGKIWASYNTDNAKTAYFESETGDWKRLLGYMDGNKLILSEDEFDSTQSLTGDGFYGKQAKVYNGKCQAPSGGGTKYYVRKFNYGGSNSDQLSKFYLTVPGATLNGTDLEVWLWAASNLNVGRRCDMATGNTDPYGFKGMAKSVSGGKIEVEVGPTIMQGEDFYIAVKIAAGKEITADMVLA